MLRSQPAQLDLNVLNCDKEPIHHIRRVQSFGGLIALTNDWIISHASENAADILGLTAPVAIGSFLTDHFSPEAIRAIKMRVGHLAYEDSTDRWFQFQPIVDGPVCDFAMCRSGQSIVLEFEHGATSDVADPNMFVRPMISRLAGCENVVDICQLAARQIRTMTKMDRVMIYQFQPDETGMVIAESKNAEVESFLGLRYPASDIPRQAREIYLRNMSRIISDVNDPGVSIASSDDPAAAPLDLSLSTIRAVSPVHLEYLRNMDVGASMSISIVVRGKLWGLIACHHRTPKIQALTLRTAAEMFGLLFSYTLEQKLSDIERREAVRSKVLHDQIMIQLAQDTSLADNFKMIADAIIEVIPFDGAIGWIGDTFQSIGMTPDQDEFSKLLPFLNTAAAGQVYASQSLAATFPHAVPYAKKAAGFLVLPVSRGPKDFIVLFRRELAETVRWAGKPTKDVTYGEFGPRLTPRKSFEVWRETLQHHCAPWTTAQIASAEALRVTLLEVILRLTDANMKEQDRAQETQEILIAELNHRVRNVLSLIKGVVGQSGKEHGDVASFAKVIDGRIHALAIAHDQITDDALAPASLRNLIAIEAAAYVKDSHNRLFITGPDVLVPPSTHTALALVLHELTTNSVKYGAFASEHGKVVVTLKENADRGLDLAWKESGGPIVNQPTRRGLGMKIIETAVPHELKGEARLRFEPTGLEAVFRMPAAVLDKIVPKPAPIQVLETATQDTSQRPLAQKVLIVEDNIIISLDAENLLHSIGVSEVVIVSNVADALDEIEKCDFGFALLDINLGGETAFPIAEQFLAKGIPFAFASGYGNLVDTKSMFQHIPVLTKPYDVADLRRVMAEPSV